MADRLSTLGGAMFIASGSLFALRSLLEWGTGPPPSTGTEILAWIAHHNQPLAFVSEVLFFATGALVPALFALYVRVSRAHPLRAVVGCGAFAIAVPLLAMLLVVHGRLIYPVFELRVRTPELAELVVATYFGGIHAVLLLFALGTAVLSTAMRGSVAAYVGLVTAALDVAGSYPDRIGPVATLVCGLVLASWFVLVGVHLLTTASDARLRYLTGASPQGACASGTGN